MLAIYTQQTENLTDSRVLSTNTTTRSFKHIRMISIVFFLLPKGIYEVKGTNGKDCRYDKAVGFVPSIYKRI